MRERDALATLLVTQMLLDFILQIQGHRHKDGDNRVQEILKVWIADCHRYHEELEIHGSNSENEDYLVI